MTEFTLGQPWSRELAFCLGPVTQNVHTLNSTGITRRLAGTVLPLASTPKWRLWLVADEPTLREQKYLWPALIVMEEWLTAGLALPANEPLQILVSPAVYILLKEV